MQQPRSDHHTLTAFWSRFPPPARPSTGDLAIYEEVLDASPTRVLLLGSTPELRSLAHRHGHDLVVVDADREMYLAMGEMVETAGPENFVQSDWLRMSFHEPFELILGDGAANMLPLELHPALFQTIAALLRPGGLCVLHTHILERVPCASVDEIVALHRSSNSGRPFFHLRDFFSQLWIDHTTGSLANRDFLARMEGLHREGRVTESEYGEFERILEGDPLVLHYPRDEDLRSTASSCLRLERVVRAQDYAGARLKPFYFLGR